MAVKDIWAAMGITSKTYYKWKKADDFPEEGSAIEVYVKYAEIRKEANHEQATAKAIEPGSLRYKQEVAKLEKLRVDIAKGKQQLVVGVQDILDEHYYQILEELSPFLRNLKDYIKEHEVLDSVLLQSLIDKAKEKTDAELSALREQKETKGEEG